MTDRYIVSKGIPLPSAKPGVTAKYPWAELEIGDSFFVPGKTGSSINGALTGQRKRGMGLVARSVIEDGVAGVRVWRTK